jgi:hypothetical protein
VSDDPIRGAADEVVLMLAPLVEAAQSANGFVNLLSNLGWTAAAAPAPLLELATAGSTLIDVMGVGSEDVSTLDVLEAIGTLAAAIAEIQTAPDAAFPSSVDIGDFRQTIGRDLIDYCVVEYLLSRRVKLGRLLRLCGVIQLVDTPATGKRRAHVRRVLDWNAVGNLISDPLSGFRNAYDWRGSTPRLSNVLSDLGALLEAYDFSLSFFTLTAAELAFANVDATEPLDGAYGIWLDIGAGLGVESPGTAGLKLFARPSAPQRAAAIAILPFADLGDSETPPNDKSVLRIRGLSELARGYAITLAPIQDPIIEAGFLDGSATEPADVRASVTLPAPLNEPERIVLGTADGSHISVQTISMTAGVEIRPTGGHEVFLELALDRLRLSIRPAADETDAFLYKLVGADGIAAELSPALRFSNVTGLHLSGAAGLEGRFPVDLQAGPVEVEAISVGVKPASRGLDLEIGASISGEFGPIAVSVERIGLNAAVRFPDPPMGNLGPLDVAFGFLPPIGMGLSVKAMGVLTGGGFVGYDPSTGRYSGQLQLQAGALGVAGIGILDTRLPSGDYSLLVLLGATFPAIQIGMGFALTGVGGLLGLNRRINQDALRSRFAAGTAGRLLSPQDPVRNVPALIADLESVFPATPGVTVLGPTVQLIWAELVHLDVGVFVELPRASQAVLLGSAYADISGDGRTYLSIRVDVIGLIDLQAETAAFDAALVDSHLLGVLDLTGGAAFRLCWGAQPYAVLSLGGFNPAYNPEPLSFPASLARIAMVHGIPTDEVYLRFEGYFAITSNTLQFGASVEAALNYGGWAIHGSLGFDALIQRVPYHFEVDIRATVNVAYSGHSLASLTLTGALSGPGPVLLRAKVCIEVLFFDVCFSHTFELGPTTPPPAPVALDLLDVLQAELLNPSRLHAGGASDPFVQLRAQAALSATPVLVPTGVPIWDQQRAPLDLLLTRLGGTPLPSPTLVSATSTTAAGNVTDWFAPGSFVDLTNDEALTSPGYELLSSGLRLAGIGGTDGPSAETTPVMRQIRLPAAASTTNPVAGFPGWLLVTSTRAASAVLAVTSETWIVIGAGGDIIGLTGAQARRVAAASGESRAIPAIDRVAAFAF